MMTLEQLHLFLKNTLLNDVVPFWMKYALDKKNGGVFSCINDIGEILSHDKFMWSQARALWSFSALCNRIENRKEWRDVADGLFRFTSQYGRDSEGQWVFRTNANGKLVEGAKSIVTDAFGIFGMTEYAKLTASQEAVQIALETMQSVEERLSVPGSYETAPYPTPPNMKAHREYMQFSLAFCELGKYLQNKEIINRGLEKGREVLDIFARKDQQILLEYVNLNNTVAATPAGRAMVPGHGIESSYFQLLNFAGMGENKYLDKACETIRWCLEKGWDNQYGGLFLGIDVENKIPVYWKNAELKLWWPHAEALAACLQAYKHCGEQWCLDWYWRIHEWTFSHFPVPKYGEWTQRLDRTGKHKIDKVVALPVKDPFHLIRSLIVAVNTLEEIIKQ
jgi:N-acylglucosamine 2-epimerase